ncbi:unnamed protein product [Cylicostephanus goldi]|uniref:G-protein coupled receptors family 1 profile domain-containing protein n=1 Tax=Cylicostephanus goldi TaxID=71465 RepID=A0A3P6QHG8_CYLGO|nr:unnamed protein product [Cylicostephanus goldi]
MQAFCHPELSRSNVTEEFALQMTHMRSTFTILQIIFCVIGITGNILNLRTLASPSLQTVPFMYIRSLAYFDLISLSAILVHFMLERTTKHYILVVYSNYVEAPFINTFLVAGLYCAFMLTVERNKTTIKLSNDGSYHIANNVDLLCREPHWTIYNYYKLIRECLRFFFVALMTLLNVIIARKLQLNNIRRRRLVRRSVPCDVGSPDHLSVKRPNSPEISFNR